MKITKPKNLALFEDYIWKVHFPLVLAIPGVKKIRVHRILEDVRGDQSLYALGEVYFDSRTAFESSMHTEEARRALQDGAKLEREAGVAMTFDYYCETTDAEIPRIEAAAQK